MWKAIAQVFDEYRIQGCSFHWGQAVWRKVQDLGLVPQYLQKKSTYRFIRKLFCLPFLPKEHIRETFDQLADLDDDHPLTPLMNYIERTWIDSIRFPIESWCVFGQSIRTNNDLEGWHRRLNKKMGTPPFYILVKGIHSEATLVERQVSMVSEMRLRRVQRKKYRSLNGRIFQAWDLYKERDLSASGLLKKISSFYSPVSE